MPRNTPIHDSEGSVKNWQIDAVQKQVDRHDFVISSFDNKLDTIINQQAKLNEVIQGRPSIQQVDQKIELIRMQLHEDLKNAIEKQDLKYQPIVVSNKWLLGLLLASGLGLFGSLIFIAIGLTR